MASFIKLVSLIILLSIAGDFLSLGRNFLYSPGDGTGVQSTILFPGADAILGPLARAAAKAISKSALKAAKKKAKDQARVAGKQKNKAKQANDKGLCVTCKPSLNSETISDSAECYVGLPVRFESSAACM